MTFVSFKSNYNLLDKAKLKGERKSRVKEETLSKAIFELFAV